MTDVDYMIQSLLESLAEIEQRLFHFFGGKFRGWWFKHKDLSQLLPFESEITPRWKTVIIREMFSEANIHQPNKRNWNPTIHKHWKASK